MSNNQRDTQFKSFAKTLTSELIKYLTSRSSLTLDEIEQEWHKIIARRVYDLVEHTLDSIAAMDYGGGPVPISSKNAIFETKDIPDLPDLPKEQE